MVEPCSQETKPRLRSGKIYRIAYKNDLSDANWTDLSGDITATDAILSWTDATATSANKRFYIVYLRN